MKYHVNENKVSYFYTFLIMLLISIPTYFALNYAVKLELIKKELILEKYTNEIQEKIYSNDIDLINSIKVKFAVYNSEGIKQISTLSKELKNLNFDVKIDYPYMYSKKKVQKNIYNISYLVTQIELNYSKTILVSLVLFFIILVNIYIINKIIIRNTAQPYEAIQKYTNVFFNDTMHELKTPLGIISLNLDLFTQKVGENKYTRRMKTALKQMQVTYEDIEYYIKNNKIRYVKEKIDLSYFLLGRIDFFQDFAESKNIEIVSLIDEEVFVFINDIELQRIIDNTLSNAIKYTGAKNKIEVNLKKYQDYCELSFKDYGQGIEDVEYIFERFSREDSSQGGLGLGLNIVKNICNKNSIKISLSSEKNIGSVFTYEIQLYKQKFLDKVENEM